MEEWQIQHIKANLSKLIHLTIVDNPGFLADLEKGGFCEDDISFVKAAETKSDRASRLFEIAMKKYNEYENLLELLSKYKMTGALIILLRGYTLYSKECPKSLSDKIKDVLQETNTQLEKLRSLMKPPKDPEYYIHRNLFYCNVLDEKSFRKKSCTQDDIFLFKGIEADKLTYVTGYETYDLSGKYDRDRDTRFFILEDDQHFLLISSETKQAVHLVEYRDDSFMLLKSSKHSEVIQQMLSHENGKMIPDVEMADMIVQTSSPCAFCISAAPGMGKTVILANLANIIQLNQSVIVLFAQLSKLVDEITSISTLEFAIEAILKYANAEDDVAGYLRESLGNGTHEFYLFLDGFDEVPESKTQVVKEFFGFINRLNHVKLVVTTRPELQHQLEEMFNLIAFKIGPLAYEDQVEFLQRYWESIKKPGKINFLNNSAHDCLTVVDMSCNGNEMTKIPLNCLKLADVFSTKLFRHSNLDVESSRTSADIMFEVCRDLIAFNMTRVEKTHREQIIQEPLIQYIKESFPNWYQEFADLFCKDNKSVPDKEFHSAALFKKTDKNSWRFTDSVMAQYFFTQLIVENMRTPCCTKFLFEKLLGGNGVEWENVKTRPAAPKNLNNFVLVIFVELHLKIFLGKHSLSELLNPHLNDKLNEHDISTALVVCCVHELDKTFDLSQEYLNRLGNTTKLRIRDQYFKYLPHLTVKNTENVTLVRKVFALTNVQFGVDVNYHIYKPSIFTLIKRFRMKNFPWASSLTPFALAVCLGKFNIVSQLLQNEYKDQPLNVKELVHLCLHDSSSNTKSVITNKISILNCIFERSGHNLDKTFLLKVTHFQNNVHRELFKHLVIRQQSYFIDKTDTKVYMLYASILISMFLLYKFILCEWLRATDCK